MESLKNCTNTTRVVKDPGQKLPVEGKPEGGEGQGSWRRQCGCIRTSEKLKQILTSFPSPPPPSPATCLLDSCPPYQRTCISAYRMHEDARSCTLAPEFRDPFRLTHEKCDDSKHTVYHKSWFVVTELVQLVQLSVTATALALYYLIYCYMQLIYFTLRSALFFHNADGPMKVTIGVVTVTSLIIGFNMILRMEKFMGFM